MIGLIRIGPLAAAARNWVSDHPARQDPRWRYPAGRSCRRESTLTARQGHYLRRRHAMGGAPGLFQPCLDRRRLGAPQTKRLQPASELIHLRGRQLLDGCLDLSDGAHDRNLTRRFRRTGSVFGGRVRSEPDPRPTPSVVATRSLRRLPSAGLLAMTAGSETKAEPPGPNSGGGSLRTVTDVVRETIRD